MVNPEIRVENGVIVGTSSDKYQNQNPIAKLLVAGFDKAIGDLVIQCDPQTIFEIGAGEGHVTEILLRRTDAEIHATDISDSVLDTTREVVTSERVIFEVVDIRDIDASSVSADLVVCCEVLEHLESPTEALELIAKLAPNVVLSVPREPIFRGLNFVRGAYVSDFGNSPGHIQHWSASQFLKLVSNYFEIVDVKKPLPWTAILGRSKFFGQ